MKILFVWSGLTGYMGDCWRELMKHDGVELKVAVDLDEDRFGGGFNADEVLRGLNWSRALDFNWTPDVVFTVGWRNRLCRAAALHDWGAGTKKVCCFDMPWEWNLRKFLARFALWGYLREFDAAFVPGRDAERYARWLGFKKNRIFKGLFSTNTRRFGEHKGGGGFLYVGRDAPDKGLDVLRAAHGRYRSNGGKWGLRIVHGVSPDALGVLYASADCFVLASTWEPWGVVLAEAAAAGLPIICTDRCGARHEVLSGNGIVVKAGDIKALSDAMAKMEGVGARGCGIDGEGGRELAKPYSCEAWSGRVISLYKKLMGEDVR